MSKSAHDRALDVAARRYLTWQALAGRPPLRGVMDAKAWPDWAHGPMFEEIERRAHELARAQSPDDQAFLAGPPPPRRRPASRRHVNPECQQGKHRNCDGKAWRDDLDDIGPCNCHCHTDHTDGQK